ncbi:MAG: hypothetical protein AAFY59_10905 [Pseudomonadota bacterium]
MALLLSCAGADENEDLKMYRLAYDGVELSFPRALLFQDVERPDSAKIYRVFEDDAQVVTLYLGNHPDFSDAAREVILRHSSAHDVVCGDRNQPRVSLECWVEFGGLSWPQRAHVIFLEDGFGRDDMARFLTGLRHRG